jgi:hypothetical protein
MGAVVHVCLLKLVFPTFAPCNKGHFFVDTLLSSYTIRAVGVATGDESSEG